MFGESGFTESARVFSKSFLIFINFVKHFFTILSTLVFNYFFVFSTPQFIGDRSQKSSQCYASSCSSSIFHRRLQHVATKPQRIYGQMQCFKAVFLRNEVTVKRSDPMTIRILVSNLREWSFTPKNGVDIQSRYFREAHKFAETY